MQFNVKWNILYNSTHRKLFHTAWQISPAQSGAMRLKRNFQQWPSPDFHFGGSTEAEEKFITQNYEHILLTRIYDLPCFFKCVTNVIPTFITLYHMIHSVALKKHHFFAQSVPVLPLRTSGYDFEPVQPVIFYLRDSILLASQCTWPYLMEINLVSPISLLAQPCFTIWL